MSNVFSKFMIFAVGATIGSAASWYIAKTKYEQLAHEEIAVMKEYYNKKRKELEGEKEEKPAEKEPTVEEPKVTNIVRNPEVEEYIDILNSHSYNLEEKGAPATMYGPYLIAPEEFGEKDHETAFLTYYADKVLAYDDTDDIVEDVDAMIGLDSLNHFGEYEEDLLFIRDDVVGTDYEISRDTRNYHDVVKSDSHPVE